MTMVNQNTIGHFDDILTTYSKINDLSRYYQYITQNIISSKAKITEICNRVKWINVAKMWGVMLLFSGILSVILALCGMQSVVAYFVLILLIPAILVVTIRYIYLWRVIPEAKNNYKKSNEEARNEYKIVYEKLSVQRQNLELLYKGLNEDCCNPLAIYIMRQAASDGVCQNVFQAQQYYLDRQKRLTERGDEKSQQTLKQLLSSRTEATKLLEFLYNLDNDAFELLNK